MLNFVDLDDSFKTPKGFDLETLSSLPIYKHHYHQPMDSDPKTLYWTEYQPFRPGDGTISFARRLYLEHPEVAKHVLEYLEFLFPSISFDIQRVNLLKTHGSIRSHVDESQRMCCVNIGIANSSGAITRTSSTKDFNLFDSVAETHQCIDGHAYLLDTSSVHEVKAMNDQPRYLFTYGFGRSFNDVLNCYRFKDKIKD